MQAAVTKPPVIEALERHKAEALQNLKENKGVKFFEDEYAKASDALRHALAKQHDADIQHNNLCATQWHEAQMQNAANNHQQYAMNLQSGLMGQATYLGFQMNLSAMQFNAMNHLASLQHPVSARRSYQAAQQPPFALPLMQVPAIGFSQ